MDNSLLEAVKFDEKGLVCAIAQDRQTRRVLMVAWMNAEALQKTVETGFAHYYSRSRQKQWMKSEESEHTQTGCPRGLPDPCSRRADRGARGRRSPG